MSKALVGKKKQKYINGKINFTGYISVCESLSARRLSGTRGEGRVVCNGGGGGRGKVFRGLIGMVVSTLCCSIRT